MAGPSRSYRRRFRALVTPALYHTVTVCKQGGPYQFEAFLCTVLSSPDDIAPLVREFRVDGCPSIDGPQPLLTLVLRLRP